MNLRIAALCSVLALLLSGCPSDGNGDAGTDAGVDAGITIGTGTCTGQCGPTQVCDEERNVCVDGCKGGCGVGTLCVKQGDTFACVSPETSCGGNACGPGQTSCIDNSCSCLPYSQASKDTCSGQGKVCHQTWNAVTQAGGACENPRTFEFCKPDCQGPDCGECPAGQGCDIRLFETFGICAHNCDPKSPTCAEDEFCYGSGEQQDQPGFCYPKSLFSAQKYGCADKRPTADGGTELFRTVASQPCLKVDNQGNRTETTATGTCTWTFLKGDTQAYPFTYCRTAGPVPEFGACKTEPLPLDLSGTCAGGLECAPVGDEGNGICLKICNAQLRADGSPTQPACGTGESCVNLYRFEDDDSVVGVCMKNCNVFSSATDYGCTALGTQPASCVPTSPAGVQLVTGSGNGLCMPQQPNAGAEGDPCVDVDPMGGAACQSGLVCSRISGEAQPRCIKPCDVECTTGDAGAPARCATEANATCDTGKTCTRVTGTTGAILGYCL